MQQQKSYIILNSHIVFPNYNNNNNNYNNNYNKHFHKFIYQHFNNVIFKKKHLCVKFNHINHLKNIITSIPNHIKYLIAQNIYNHCIHLFKFLYNFNLYIPNIHINDISIINYNKIIFNNPNKISYNYNKYNNQDIQALAHLITNIININNSIEHIKYTPLFNFINNANSNLPTSRKLIFI